MSNENIQIRFSFPSFLEKGKIFTQLNGGAVYYTDSMDTLNQILTLLSLVTNQKRNQ